MHPEVAPLRDALASAASGSPALTAWRISWSLSRGASVGVKDSEPANAHSPLSLDESLGVSLLLQWSDGRIASARVDRSRLGGGAEVLARARESSYEDADAAVFAGPQELPEVALFSPAASAITDGAVEPLGELVEAARATARDHRFELFSGSASATRSTGGVVTSLGCEAESDSTTASYSFWFEGRAGDGLARREPIPAARARERLEVGADYTQRLASREESFEGGLLPVILHPHVAQPFFMAYVIGNLSGEAVWNRQSAFRIEQFQAGEALFREDLGFSVNPLVPLSPGSYRFTSEGLPARRAEYVRAGRLVNPILNLKYARRFGLDPVPPPSAIDSMVFGADGRPAFEQAFADIPRGLLVLQVLGLHTQDATSGDFSLSAPLSLAVRSGRLGAHVRAALSGNFLQALRSTDLRLVDFPGFHMPGLQLTAHVSVE